MTSAYKPIIISFSGLTANKMYTYAVTLRNYPAVFVEVYRGRCIASSSGTVDVLIDDVYRDYVHQHCRVWEQSIQDYRPAALGDFVTPRSPDNYIYNYYRVHLYDGGTDVDVVSGYIWSGWLPVTWPQVTSLLSTDINFALIGNSIVSHVPPVDTNNMWVGLVIKWFFSNEVPLFGTEDTQVALPFNQYGTYDLAYTLADIQTALNTALNGEELLLYYNDTVVPVAHVDECAAPYYVAWYLPNGGWFCWGFEGNVTTASTPEVSQITDMMNSDKVVCMDAQQTFNMYTGFLTRDEYNVLTTLAFASEVYVYDAVNDHGAWCTVDGRTLPTAGNVRWKNTPFNITMKEIMHKEL